jgi:hypothetical protein
VNNAMGVKLFYKNQVEIAGVINDLIDRYWEHSIDEPSLIESINKLYVSILPNGGVENVRNYYLENSFSLLFISSGVILLLRRYTLCFTF